VPLDDSEDIQRIKKRDWLGLEALIERYQLRAVRAAYLDKTIISPGT
jgi:hypothetical protein